MKSKIPWNNYIMRKFGNGIHDQIKKLAVETGIKEKMYQKRIVWTTNQVGRC